MKRAVLLAAVFIATILQAQTVPHGVTLTWGWAGTGTATFNVYRATTSGAEVKPALVTGLTAKTYVDNTAVVGTKYFYTVTATVGGVEGLPSLEVGAQIVVPDPPTNPQTAIF